MVIVLFLPIFVGNIHVYYCSLNEKMNLKRSKNIVCRASLSTLMLTVSLPLMAQADLKNIERLFDFVHTTAYFSAAFLIGFFVLLFYNFVYHYREQDAKMKGLSQYGRLSLVLQTGGLRLCFYNMRRRHCIFIEEGGEFSKEYDPIEFASLFEREDIEEVRKMVFAIGEGRLPSGKVRVRGLKKEDGSRKIYDFSISVARRRNHKEVEDLLFILHDVSDIETRREKVNKLMLRYQTVFESSLVDMVYYDKYGVLTGINEKACQQFGVKDPETAIREGFLLKNNPFYSGVDLHQMDNTRTSSIVDFDQFADPVYKTEELGLHGKMYYESTINPIRNEKGELEGVYMAGRNVTEMVESFHHQQEGFKRLSEMTKDIKRYISNVNYALRVSEVRLVNYVPSKYTLELSDNLNETQLYLSQLRCIRLGTPRFRRAISSALNRMDHRTTHPVELLIETEIHDEQRRPVWLQFNMIPLLNAEGQVERYFGMCRNMTQMVETERQLAIESQKAQETELLKQAFLTNMSYEIRTPLNTVIGFAELFESEHDEADEPLFVNEIHQNSNSLLQLVNDILFLSRLDANMIELKKDEADFAMLFESWCQMGLVNVNPEVKVIIENPYERLLVSIDLEHVGKILERLCSVAASYTEKGIIRAKYEYRHGELAISIEDTGRGIDEKTLPHAFERFVRDEQDGVCGTGLDLPIVQALVQQMGGTIELQSEYGKGTTVWVFIPCEASVIEKRREIV